MLLTCLLREADAPQPIEWQPAYAMGVIDLDPSPQSGLNRKNAINPRACGQLHPAHVGPPGEFRPLATSIPARLPYRLVISSATVRSRDMRIGQSIPQDGAHA